MTGVFDNMFISLGVNAQELRGLKGRTAVYLGLAAMALTASTLVGSLAVRVLF